MPPDPREIGQIDAGRFVDLEKGREPAPKVPFRVSLVVAARRQERQIEHSEGRWDSIHGRLGTDSGGPPELLTDGRYIASKRGDELGLGDGSILGTRDPPK